MYEKPAAPQSIGGVLDDGFKVFKISFKQVVALAFVGALIGSLPSVYIMRNIQSDIPDPESVQEIFSPAFFGMIFLSSVVGLVIFAAILARIDAVATGKDCSIGQALGQGVRRFPALFVSGLLYAVVVGIGMILLIIPGIILSVSLYGTLYLVVIDKLGPIAALKQSHNLVWGDWWRTATILTVSLIIAMVVFLLIGIVGGIFAVSGNDTSQIAVMPLWFDLLVSPVVTALVMPLLYAMPYAMLQDLKLRRAGDDLVQRMESLDSA